MLPFKRMGSSRVVFLRAPIEWNAKGARRIWKLRAPGNGINDAPAAPNGSLRKFLVTSEVSPAKVGLKFVASTCDPCLYFPFRASGCAVGAFATRIDDVPGSGEPGII